MLHSQVYGSLLLFPEVSSLSTDWLPIMHMPRQRHKSRPHGSCMFGPSGVPYRANHSCSSTVSDCNFTNSWTKYFNLSKQKDIFGGNLPAYNALTPSFFCKTFPNMARKFGAFEDVG